jgi:hypothetical protein
VEGPHPYARSRQAARALGVAIREVNAATDDEFDAAFARLIQGQDDRRRYLFPQPAQPTLLAGGTHHRLAPISALMARQQFVAHPFRIHSGPSLAALRECANSLIADEPCYLRDRKVALTEIVHGEIGAELLENFTEPQAFRSQPSRQRPVTHA